MGDERERSLISKGSPCNINYFDNTLLTLQQAVERGEEYCPNLDRCMEDDNLCALLLGNQVAKLVVEGKDLKEAMKDFESFKYIDNSFWNSIDGKEFKVMQGKQEMIRAVEGFARVILLMNPFESVYNLCEKCGGVRLVETVYDSIHDGPFPLSGSGKTIARDVEYCPKCDPKPRGGILKQDPSEAKERKFLRKLSEDE